MSSKKSSLNKTSFSSLFKYLEEFIFSFNESIVTSSCSKKLSIYNFEKVLHWGRSGLSNKNWVAIR